MIDRAWKSRTVPAILLAFALFAPRLAAAASLADTIVDVQPKMVKIYGAGGLRGLEAYQSGMLISTAGHVLTAFSYVLDTDQITVTLDDGRRFEAKLLGAEPRLDLAVLKIEAAELPYFDLESAVEGRTGMRVLAFSNLFGVATGDEPASVQRGIVASVSTLSARRGTFKTPYRGRVYVVDAMTNNPGAAGGALTNLRGELLGVLGKELRNTHTSTWLNYALPIAELRRPVDDIIAGKFRRSSPNEQERAIHPVDLASLGLILVPNVVDSTPPYVDSVLPGSPAARAGLREDDLLLFFGDVLVQSVRDVHEECRRIERDRLLRLTVRRGQELLVLNLSGKQNKSD